jgi:hypothetical protein
MNMSLVEHCNTRPVSLAHNSIPLEIDLGSIGRIPGGATAARRLLRRCPA